jgi:hypothetical protein
MRAPPAVSIDVHPGLGWRAGQSLLHAGAAAAVALWAGSWLEWPGEWLVPAAVGAAAAAAALGWRLSATPAMRLTWSGAQWTLGIAGREAVVLHPPQVMIDLGEWLLLRVQPDGAGTRLWLPMARVDGASWHLLRAAVYSSAPDPASRAPGDRPPF